MFYYRAAAVLVLLALMGVSQGYTDITLFNCPAQFNVAAYNTTEDSTMADLGSKLYAAFETEEHKRKVRNIVISGDEQQLEEYMDELRIPYIVVAVLFGALYLTVVVCCLFERSCPPCETIRRDLEEQPYTKCETRLSMIALLVICAGIMVTVLVAFSFIPKIKENLEMTQCSIYLGIDTALYGDGTWGGFEALRNNVGNITNLLSAAVTQIQIYFPGDNWLVDTMQTMKTDNLNIFKTYNASQMITPNPDTTTTATNAGQDTPRIDSRFIKTGMGPNGTANTMLTDIDLGLRTTQRLSDQAYAITTSAKLLQASQASIISNSQAQQNTLLMYIHQLGVMKTEFDEISDRYFEKEFARDMSVFQGIFGVVLAGSMVAMLGLMATHVCNLLTCRYMVHLGWTIFGLSYAGVLLVLYEVLSVGSVGYSFCSFLDEMLQNQDTYKELGESYTQNAFMRVDQCLFGDGDALAKFSLRQEMSTVENIFTNIITYNEYNNALSTNYVNTAISTGKISGWIGAMSNYKLGVYVDADESITSNDNPNYAINQLNLYTYQGGGVATGSKDVWVWDAVNCTDPSYIVYAAGASAGITLSTSNVTCISFNEKLTTSSTSSWSFSDFTMRYVQIRQDFSDAYNFIQSYGATLIAHRDSRVNLFQAIEDKLSDLLTLNNNFNSLLTDFKTRVGQFESSVFTLNNLISDTQSGLIYTSNCSPLGDNMRFTYNVFCVNFMAHTTKLAICCLALLVLMVGGVFCGARFGMIYAQAEKQKRITMPEEGQSEKDIVIVDKLNTSNDSNSSDQNRH